MKSSKKIIFVIFLFLISIGVVSAKEKVTFSKCVDGDTIKVLVGGEERTVRLIAVNTPESVHPTKGVEYYGKEASDYTCNLVTNAKKIELEYDDNCDKEDKYKRLLAWVWVDDLLLEDELIKNGYAEVDYLYAKYKYTDTLKDHQSIAESKKIGIWNEDVRKEFDPDSTKSKKTSTEKEEETTIDFENMSTKEIIIIIVVLVIVILLGPTIKKWKRKVNKYLK